MVYVKRFKNSIGLLKSLIVSFLVFIFLFVMLLARFGHNLGYKMGLVDKAKADVLGSGPGTPGVDIAAKATCSSNDAY